VVGGGRLSELRPIYQCCRALTFALARLSCYISVITGLISDWETKSCQIVKVYIISITVWLSTKKITTEKYLAPINWQIQVSLFKSNFPIFGKICCVLCLHVTFAQCFISLGYTVYVYLTMMNRFIYAPFSSRFLEIAFSQLSGLCSNGFRYCNRNKPPPLSKRCSIAASLDSVKLLSMQLVLQWEINTTLTHSTQCSLVYITLSA